MAPPPSSPRSNIYRSPLMQVVIVGFTCFATVGMYLAVSALGAGGTEDITLSDISNVVLYAVFAFAGLVSGGINNLLGPRITLFLGTLGYALYVGSLWCFQSQGTQWFLILSGAMLGLTAALLWTAQGVIVMSYPLEKDRGKAFGIFWAIYQSGSLIGSVIALAINAETGSLSAVSTSTYIAFMAIIFIGVASSLFVLPPHLVVRADGNTVQLDTATKVRDELLGMLAAIKDWRLVALVPMFFASDFYNPYFGALNQSVFDGPTRALNATLGSAGEIIGSILIGYCVLDVQWLHRRQRGYFGVAVVAISVIVVWSLGLSWQVPFKRDYKTVNGFMNYHDPEYWGKGVLFFFYYFTDACYQALLYWTLSALSSDSFTVARYAGVCRSVRSAGSAGAYAMDAVLTPLLNEHLASWIMMLCTFIPVLFVMRTIKDINEQEKGINITDVEQEIRSYHSAEKCSGSADANLASSSQTTTM